MSLNFQHQNQGARLNLWMLSRHFIRDKFWGRDTTAKNTQEKIDNEPISMLCLGVEPNLYVEWPMTLRLSQILHVCCQYTNRSLISQSPCSIYSNFLTHESLNFANFWTQALAYFFVWNRVPAKRYVPRTFNFYLQTLDKIKQKARVRWNLHLRIEPNLGCHCPC